MKQNSSLHHLKVIEFSSVLAGPAVGMFFAELGAEVIKVENLRTGGDLTRNWKQTGEDTNAPFSNYYHSVNWGKKSMMLDLTDAQTSVQVMDMLHDADIMISNFKSGDAEKFNLESNTLRKLFPRLIIAEVTGFISENRVAYDAVLQAECGWMSLNGERHAKPLKVPIAFIDLFAAHQLKEGILLALLQRSESGQGAIVRVSLQAAAISALANQASNYLNSGIVPMAQGSEHPNIAPYGELFLTKDGQWILLAVGTNEQFRRCCQVLGLPDLPNDLRFNENQNRLLNRASLVALMKERFAQLEASDVMDQFNALQVPAGQVKFLDQVFDSAETQKLILHQQEADGTTSKRVQTVAFTIEN